jgi:hypothetical protein
VFVTALVLVVVGICVCLAGMRKAFSMLGVDPMQVFVWLGLAEVPAPRVAPRTRVRA